MSARPSSNLNPTAIDQRNAWKHLLSLPLAQPARAEQEFIAALDSTLLAPPDNATMFSLLEQTRAPLCFVREAAVRHYLEKAPYLEGDTESHFQRGVEAIRRMIRSYISCTSVNDLRDPTCLADDPVRAQYVATVLHRCLYYSGMMIFEHYRAKRELPAGIWAQHNSLFATARRLGVATLQIDDRIFEESRPSHCQAAFVIPLLAEQACPYGRNPRDLNLVWQWAEKLAPEVNVCPIAQLSPISGFGVDLEQDAPLRGLQPISHGKGGHQLETGAAIQRLRQILEDLEGGVPPEQLGLCPETLGNSRELLEQLISLWSLESSQRRQQPRIPQKSMVRLCTGFHAMHHFILSTAPNLAGLAQLKRLVGSKAGQHEEKWELLDRGPSGFRLACPAAATRLANRQLLALHLESSPGYLLCQVTWLKREQSGRLLAGVALLHGIPLAVCIRAIPQIKGEKSSFVRAFLLRREPGLSMDASLLLPPGMQGRGAEMEMFHDHSRQIVLGDEIRSGPDFVQVDFSDV